MVRLAGVSATDIKKAGFTTKRALVTELKERKLTGRDFKDEPVLLKYANNIITRKKKERAIAKLKTAQKKLEIKRKKTEARTLATIKRVKERLAIANNAQLTLTFWGTLTKANQKKKAKGEAYTARTRKYEGNDYQLRDGPISIIVNGKVVEGLKKGDRLSVGNPKWKSFLKRLEKYKNNFDY
jgi:hypothetical protein